VASNYTEVLLRIILPSEAVKTNRQGRSFAQRLAQLHHHSKFNDRTNFHLNYIAVTYQCVFRISIPNCLAFPILAQKLCLPAAQKISKPKSFELLCRAKPLNAADPLGDFFTSL
jgi:hypothetical protein